ncbi:S8 family peptidase [Botrimarina mediterranea]|uniref:S8 family peptidase n=1 Tax=Botrimarina mediterranea TaxID=2528022 RepID=UPI003AF32323
MIETVGSVQNFATAVRNLEGLEWLGEFEIDELAPDEDFFNVNSKGEATTKPLVGRLYLVFTNQTALSQLLGLWDRYSSDEKMVWPTGLTSLRDVFKKLHAIRRWSVQDRLVDSGVLKYWEEDLLHAPRESIRTEIELWYRGAPAQRSNAQAEVERIVTSTGGTVLRACEIAGIAYHAILAELPREAVKMIIENPATELVRCDSIMFFRPTGQVAAGDPGMEEPIDSPVDEEPLTYPNGDPVIAVLDGLPVENHVLLRDRLIIDDPDDLASAYPVSDRIHGTSMCSLVVWGDLSEENDPLSRPVYVRPVMRPMDSISTPHPEAMPSDQLTIDYVHRAVRRLFEGDAGDAAAAETVKIINFSIGDRSRPFLQMVSPLARLIDWLSHKYGVLFVVSAGNQLAGIDVGVTRAEFEDMSEAQRNDLVIRVLYENSRHRQLLSPGETINGVTVNSIHQDASGYGANGRHFELFTTPLPSPVSSFGSGYRRAIKPDIAYPGGRVLYDFAMLGNSVECSARRSKPGHRTASPGALPGENDRSAFCRGTSNSAALLSRELAGAYEVLQEILAEQVADVDADPFISPLLKAMLVHSSEWGLAGDRLNEILANAVPSRGLRLAVSRLLGYGIPDIQRVLECTGQRATVLGFGSLEEGKGHSFRLPLPVGLAARKVPRRLTVTLAWLSPIAPTNQRYRSARLWFDLKGNRVAKERQEADHHAVRRGTVQHEIFEGADAIPITDGDSIAIKVGCRSDTQPLGAPINYALAVSLEVKEGLNIAIYDEVLATLRPAVEVPARSRVR